MTKITVPLPKRKDLNFDFVKEDKNYKKQTTDKDAVFTLQ